jgi:phage-related protein
MKDASDFKVKQKGELQRAHDCNEFLRVKFHYRRGGKFIWRLPREAKEIRLKARERG